MNGKRMNAKGKTYRKEETRNKSHKCGMKGKERQKGKKK
jgi:hypothetical protein